MDYRVILLLILEGAFALWLLYRAGLMKKPAYAAAAVILVILAFGARFAVLDYQTLDYQDFLSRWVDYFRRSGGFRALREQVGNYNIPYLYFLALFSYSSISDLYLIKLLSIFFDIILAWASMLLLGRYTQSPARRMGLFFTVLFLPTVFLNGSLWAQCDSSYVALAVLGIYLALDDRPVLSMVCAALSFGFKLQAVFILPVYAVLWMQGKFKWQHFLVFPAAYVVLVLPAVLLGRPFVETLTLYFNQTGSIGDGLNYNSPSVYSLFQYSLPEQYNELASQLGIIAAFVYLAVLLLICFFNRRRISDKAVLGAALLFAIGIPFLLPHMHDRYFFAADILSLILAFTAAEYFIAAVLVQFASLLGYHAYLKMRYLLLMDKGAAALIAALAVTSIFFYNSLCEKKKKKRKINA